MEKVYIVWYYDGYHRELSRVFRTEEEAEAFVSANQDSRGELEWDVYDFDTLEE